MMLVWYLNPIFSNPEEGGTFLRDCIGGKFSLERPALLCEMSAFSCDSSKRESCSGMKKIVFDM